MDALPFKRVKTDLSTAFAPSKCVICQQSSNMKITVTENGRTQIISAAAIHKDAVSERLEVADHTSFVYHMSNDCYKNTR